MISDTVRYYLTQHPRDSVRVLEAASVADLKAFIEALEPEDQAVLLGNLLPQTAGIYLAGIAADDAAEIVERLRAGVAAAMLGSLTQSKRRPILDALPEEKRANIRHLLRYPDDSAGSIMLTNTLVCRIDATVRRAKQLVRRYALTELPVMVVVDDAMKPVGLIAVSKLLSVRERELVKDHLRSVPARLNAHAEVRTILALPAWNTEDYLPVTEGGGRYVGLLPKARLHRHALAAPAGAEGSNDFATTVLALADMVWGPAADVLARAASGPVEKVDD